MASCRNCARRGWVWEGPTRVECPECKGTGNREAKTLAPGQGLNAIGPRKRDKMDQVRAHKDAYLQGEPGGKCQTCQGYTLREESEFSHKRAAGMGGAGDIGGVVDPKNGTYSCRCCHAFVTEDREAEAEHRACAANMENKLPVVFSPAVRARWEAWREHWYNKGRYV